jgi:hypothetical protein
MGAAELEAGQHGVRLVGEIAIGIEQQLHALAQFLFPQEEGIHT